MEILGGVEDLEHIHKTNGGSTFLRGNEKLFSCISTSAKSQKVHLRGFKGARNTLLPWILPQMKNDRALLRRRTVSPSPLIADGVFIFYLCSSKQDIFWWLLRRSPPTDLPGSSSLSSSPLPAAPGNTFRDLGRILPEPQTPTSLSLFLFLFPPPGLDWWRRDCIPTGLVTRKRRRGGGRARDRKWVVLLCRSSVRPTPEPPRD